MYKASVIKYPSGKYGFAGSIPKSLMIKDKNHLGQEYYKSPIFKTELEAKKALKVNVNGYEIKHNERDKVMNTLNCIEKIDYVGGTKYRCLVHDADIDIDPDFWDDDNAITPVCEARASI